MQISTKKLLNYRTEKYYLNHGQRLNSLQEAVDFVNERGFVHFWPITGVELPSLWIAVAGNRPVADAHDDPGHVSWGWKDESLGKDLWYYGKILRKKATMIALDVVPYFYALSRNYGNPEEDILIDFYDGRLTNEARQVFEVIQKNGPMDTIAIRKASAMTTKQSNSPFDRAMTYLQSDFKILPVGISDSGGWRYAFIYDLVHRHFPDLPIKAQQISEQQARSYLLGLYFTSVGAASWRDITKLFQWGRKNTEIAINDLLAEGNIVQDVEYPPQPGKWFSQETLLA